MPFSKTFYTYNNDKQITQIERPDGQKIVYNYNATNGRLTSYGITGSMYTMGTNFHGKKPQIINWPGGGYTQFTYSGESIVNTSNYSSTGMISQYAPTFFRGVYLASDVVSGGTGSSSSISYTYNNDEDLITAGSLSLTYNVPDGKLATTSIGTAGADVTDSYTYNNFGEVTAYQAKYGSTVIYELNLTRDGLGRISDRSEFMNSLTNDYAYTFDLAGRLTQVDKNLATEATYSYDLNSNRTGGTIGAQPTSATYDTHDRLESYNANSYTYTANGELTSKVNSSLSSTTSYTYDVYGNLTKVILPSTDIITYETDALNRRIGKKVNGIVQKRWAYMDQYRIAAELSSTNAITKRFIYASKKNIPDYMIEGGVTYRIISDHLGSPRLVVRLSDGNIMQRMNHDEFGRVTEDTNPGYIPFGFAGGVYDSHTQLVRFGARDYDPEVGRWTSKDPILFNGGDTNLFGYVQNDPVNLIDPTGNCPWCIGAVIGGIASGVSAYLAGGDARTVAVSAVVGAVAGAASMGVSAFTSSATATIAANAAIGVGANIVTQIATGTAPGALNYSQVGIGALAGGIGAGLGLGAGTAAFYGTPVVGRSIGVGLARSNEFWASLLTGTAIGTTIEGAGACR